MSSLNNTGGKLIAQKAKEDDDIEDIFASTYVYQSAVIKNPSIDISSPKGKRAKVICMKKRPIQWARMANISTSRLTGIWTS